MSPKLILLALSFVSLMTLTGPQIAIATERATETVLPDQDASPIKRVPPIMPRTAKHSGHCKMMFDVSAKGRTTNVRVTSCSDYLFFDNGIEAVQKWVYSPKIENGVAVTRKDVETKITYRLADQKGKPMPESDPVPETSDYSKKHKAALTMTTKFPHGYARASRLPREEHCCMTFDLSQTGSPFNVEAESCTDFNLVKRSDDFVRNLTFEPITENGQAVSSGVYTMLLEFVDIMKLSKKSQTRKHRLPVLGHAQKYEQLCGKGF